MTDAEFKVSPAEEALIRILRDEYEVDFALAVSRAEGAFSFSISTADDWVAAHGHDSSFRGAMLHAWGLAGMKTTMSLKDKIAAGLFRVVTGVHGG